MTRRRRKTIARRREFKRYAAGVAVPWRQMQRMMRKPRSEIERIYCDVLQFGRAMPPTTLTPLALAHHMVASRRHHEHFAAPMGRETL